MSEVIFRRDLLTGAQSDAIDQLAQIGDAFKLYGGAALVGVFGHRETRDLDFFSRNEFDPDALLSSSSFIKGGTVLQKERNTLTVRTGNGLHVSFFGGIDIEPAAPYLQVTERIFSASPLDIGATKLNTILGRSKVEDYIDLAEIELRGPGIEACLQATSKVWGPSFSKSESLRALAYLEDPHLAKLPEAHKSTIRAAVQRIMGRDQAVPRGDRGFER